MSPTVQVIARNLSLFEGQCWAIFNPDDAAIFSLHDAFQLGLHHDFAIYEASLAHAPKQVFLRQNTSDLNDIELDGVIIFMPRAKDVLTLLLQQACSLLAAGKKLIVIGEHAKGVKSAPKYMQDFVTDIQKYDNARRCSLFIGHSLENTRFRLDEFTKFQTVKIKDTMLEIATLPSVFGHKKLDPATQMLLTELPALENIRSFYDFACGSGVISAYILKQYPEMKATLSDVHSLSLFTAKKTLSANNVSAQIIAADGCAKLENKVDLIVCNPPFHQGNKNDYAITQNFIRQAYDRLAIQGRLIMVANRFLPYADSLDASFGEYSIIQQDNKYVVYSAQKRAH